MARTGCTGPRLKPTAAAGSSRALPLIRTHWDPTTFTADIDRIVANQVNNVPNGVVLTIPEYVDPLGYFEESSDPDAPSAAWREGWDVQRCWKTTVAYEQIIGTSTSSTSSTSSSIIQVHPRLAGFIGRDPWTSFPILARPWGPPLDRFLDQNKAAMYDQGSTSHRIKTAFRPLAYKWALHLASALEFVHSQDIILGDLRTDHCWLSSTGGRAFSLLLVGFLDASFRDRRSGIRYLGGTCMSESFHPLNVRQPGSRRSPEPSFETDVFLWGCVVYQLMVGHWPGKEGWRSWADMDMMIPRQEWPKLEREYLGQLVKKCWTGEVGSSQRLRENLVEFLQAEGWHVEDGDDLQFDASSLFPEILTHWH